MRYLERCPLHFSEDFACEANAKSALSAFEKTLKYHRLVESTVVQKAHYPGKGCPSKGATPTHYTYHPAAQLAINPDAMAIAETKAGRFIIATNRLQLSTLDGLEAGDIEVITPPQGDERASDQKGKPTARPTLRWILQCFHTVHLIWVNGTKVGIKLTQRQRHILSFLDPPCQRYYLLS